MLVFALSRSPLRAPARVALAPETNPTACDSFPSRVGPGGPCFPLIDTPMPYCDIPYGEHSGTRAFDARALPAGMS